MKEDFSRFLVKKGSLCHLQLRLNTTLESHEIKEKEHTASLFVAVKSCGTVILVDELYGCESISQVYGIMIEWLSNLSDLKSITIMLYDDNCHLGEYSENKERAMKNEATQQFASIGKYIDKFHLKNHIGKRCVDKRDPYKIKRT